MEQMLTSAWVLAVVCLLAAACDEGTSGSSGCVAFPDWEVSECTTETCADSDAPFCRMVPMDYCEVEGEALRWESYSTCDGGWL